MVTSQHAFSKMQTVLCAGRTGFHGYAGGGLQKPDKQITAPYTGLQSDCRGVVL